MGLRILLQCLYYPPEVGGLESHVSGLSEGLVLRGHRVRMLTSRSMPGLRRKEEVGGVEVHRVWMPGRSPAAWSAHIGATIPVHARLAREAEIFHTHTFACVVPSTISRAFRSRPLVVTLHTSHFLARAQKPVWRPIMRRLIRSADYLLTTSEEIRRVALEIYPHPRSEVMTNAVDTNRFVPGTTPDNRSGSSTPGRRRLIVPRRLFRKNGVEYFIRSLPLIVRELDVEAWIVGDGPEREKLTELAGELGVRDRVEFLGARSNQEMPGLFRDAEVAVIPSLMEATSIAALEAMSCGLPVAASSVGGLPEIIDEQVGILFRPADPKALAESVVSLLRRTDLQELGQKARHRVISKWSLGRMVDRHVEIYQQLRDEAQARRS